MIKIIKWELLKEFTILKWVFLLLFSFLLVLLILPAKTITKINNSYDIFLYFSLLIIWAITFFFTFIYPSISLIWELRQSYLILEKSIPKPFVKILLARTIVNMLIFSTFTAISYIGIKLMTRFWIVQSISEPSYWYTLLNTVIFYPLSIQFFYLSVSIIPVLKKYPIIFATIITASFIEIMTALGSLSITILALFQICIAIAAFLGSCLLYEKYYIPK